MFKVLGIFEAFALKHPIIVGIFTQTEICAIKYKWNVDMLICVNLNVDCVYPVTLLGSKIGMICMLPGQPKQLELW